MPRDDPLTLHCHGDKGPKVKQRHHEGGQTLTKAGGKDPHVLQRRVCILIRGCTRVCLCVCGITKG